MAGNSKKHSLITSQPIELFKKNSQFIISRRALEKIFTSLVEILILLSIM